MRYILNMASGENITDETGYDFDQTEKMPLNEARMPMQALQTRLAMVETTGATSQTISLAGIDIEALLEAIKD